MGGEQEDCFDVALVAGILVQALWLPKSCEKEKKSEQNPML